MYKFLDELDCNSYGFCMRHGPADGATWSYAQEFCAQHNMVLPLPLVHGENDAFKNVGPTWLALDFNAVINGTLVYYYT